MRQGGSGGRGREARGQGTRCCAPTCLKSYEFLLPFQCLPPRHAQLKGLGGMEGLVGGLYHIHLPPPPSPVRPQLKGSSQQQQLDGWDALYLDYQVEWPMGLLLTPPVMARQVTM